LLAALQGGWVGLAVLLALATAVSFFYYLRILVVFFSVSKEKPAPPARLSFGTGLVLAGAAALTIGAGIFAQPFLVAG